MNLLSEGTLVNDAFFQRDSPDTDSRESIAALASAHEDIRQFVQFSEFTIHGNGEPINNHSMAHTYMIKIIIPPETKNADSSC